MKRNILLSLFFTIPLLFLSAKPTILLNTSHKGSITQVLFHEASNLVFSSAADGTIKAWDIRTKELSKTVLHTNLPIKSFVLNPIKSQIAVLESDNVRLHKVTLWNWQTGKLLKTIHLKAEPISIGYSTSGNYFFINKVDIPSISIINTGSGKELSYLQNIPKVISFSFIGSSERTIMTYSSTGLIQYWDLKTGTLKKEVECVADLKNWHISENLKYLIGTRNNDILVIDRLSGAVTYKETQEDLTNTRVIYQKDDIILLSIEGNNTQVKHLAYNENRYQKGYLERSLNNVNMTSLTYGKNIALGGTYTGEIYFFYLRSRVLKPFALDIINPIIDYTLNENNLLITTKESMYRLSSEFFRSLEIENLNANQFIQTELPISYSFSSSGNGIYLLPKNDKGNAFELSTEDFILTDLDKTFDPVRSIKNNNLNQVILSESGQIQVFNSRWTPLFSYNYLGLMDSALYQEDKVIAGHVAKRGSPLLLLNFKTTESLPIDDPALLVYKLRGDVENLYTLALEKRESKTFTQLKQYSGSLLEESSVLQEIEGEELDHDIYLEDNSIFTTIPDHQIHKKTGNKWKHFESNSNYIVEIKGFNKLIIGKNRDYSISFWDRSSRKFLGDLYFLKSGHWLFLDVNGNYYGPEGAGEFLSFFYN